MSSPNKSLRDEDILDKTPGDDEEPNFLLTKLDEDREEFVRIFRPYGSTRELWNRTQAALDSVTFSQLCTNALQLNAIG